MFMSFGDWMNMVGSNWSGSMMNGLVGLGIIGFLIIIGAALFWLWMLVDLLQRKKFEDKLVWVLVVLFLNILGAILYYFLVYSKKRY